MWQVFPHYWTVWLWCMIRLNSSIWIGGIRACSIISVGGNDYISMVICRSTSEKLLYTVEQNCPPGCIHPWNPSPFTCPIGPPLSSPKSAGRMECGPERPPGGLRGQVGGKRGNGLGVVARVVGKLDRDRLGRPVGYGSIQLLDGPLSFNALVKADKADTFRQAWTKKNDKMMRD